MIEIKVFASGSSGNAYYISDNTTPLLLECGIPWKQIQQGLNFRASEVAGCLLSHEHQDHSKAAKDMMKAGIDCYASAGTIEALGLSGHRIKPIRAREQFQLGSWVVLPFETEHDCTESLGFLLANQAGEKLLYATDTYYIRYRFRELSVIMIECNYSMDILRQNVASGAVPAEMKSRIIRSHMSLETVKAFLKANDLSRVEAIYLIHLSDGNADATRFKREIQALTGKPTYIG